MTSEPDVLRFCSFTILSQQSSIATLWFARHQPQPALIMRALTQSNTYSTNTWPGDQTTWTAGSHTWIGRPIKKELFQGKIKQTRQSSESTQFHISCHLHYHTALYCTFPRVNFSYILRSFYCCNNTIGHFLYRHFLYRHFFYRHFFYPVGSFPRVDGRGHNPSTSSTWLLANVHPHLYDTGYGYDNIISYPSYNIHGTGQYCIPSCRRRERFIFRSGPGSPTLVNTEKGPKPQVVG